MLRFLIKKIIPSCDLVCIAKYLSPADNTKCVRFRDVKSILVIRLDQIGDVVLTTPFLRELRKNYPKAKIHLIVKPQLKNIFELCPHIDKLFVFNWQSPKLISPYMSFFKACFFAKRLLKKEKYDLAIIPRWDVDYYYATFIAYFSAAKERVGFSEKVSQKKVLYNKNYDQLLTRAIIKYQPMHEAEMTLSLVSELGGVVSDKKLELWLSEKDKSFAKKILPDDKSFIIAIAPGSLAKNKRWPIENFLKVAQYCVSSFNATIIGIGDKNERFLGKYLEDNLPSKSYINLMGMLTLRQVAATLRFCKLFVGNDTGPKHIAAAVGCKVVEITRFSKTGTDSHLQSPFRFRVWGVENTVLQPQKAVLPCVDSCKMNEAHCILEVKVRDVQSAIENILKSN